MMSAQPQTHLSSLSMKDDSSTELEAARLRDLLRCLDEDDG